MKTIRGICLGSSNSGKTSMLNHLQYGRYVLPPPTAGVDYTSIVIDDIRLQIWDTSGSGRFHRVSMVFAKEVSIVIYVFDISCNISLQCAINYHDEILQQPNIPQNFFIIGNKKDLQKRASNIQPTLKKYPSLIYYETDSSSLENLKEVFNDIVVKSYDLASMPRLTIERNNNNRSNECCAIL